MIDRTYIYSISLDFPVLLSEPHEQRVYMEWRGLALKSPPTLEWIGNNRHVAVLKAWREHGCAVIKLQHPDRDYVSVDYVIDWITRTPDGRFILLLFLAPGWPGDGLAKMILTYFAGDKIVTMSDSDFDESLAAAKSDMASRQGKPGCDAEELFGRMPDAGSLEEQIRLAAHLRLLRVEQDRKQTCIKCDAEVADNDNFCAKCGTKRCAPECTKCGEQVTTAKDARVRYHSENGSYPWHFGWDGKCIHCGFEFSAQIIARGGHNLFFSEHAQAIVEELTAHPEKFPDSEKIWEGKTTINIGMDQSVLMDYDAWDYQPTIAFSLMRWREANPADPSSLKKIETFALTPKEWFAIAEQLNGPLGVLLARQPWSRDTT
jgi:hypothetical protein